MKTNMKIAITGHRPNKLDNDYDLKSPLIKQIRVEIMYNIMKHTSELEEYIFITGMALGVDTLFAQMAIQMKLPFIVAIPFDGQERMWPEKSQKMYHDIISKAKELHIVSSAYSLNPYQKRNEWMVDNCDLLIAVWDGSSGGTANCVRYALSKGFILNSEMEGDKKIININPNDIRSTLV